MYSSTNDEMKISILLESTVDSLYVDIFCTYDIIDYSPFELNTENVCHYKKVNVHIKSCRYTHCQIYEFQN